MEKMTMCRICLVDNVRMHVVSNRNLQEVYEKLTDTPFVTEDHRPMLACFFCYTKLKQCWQLQRKCLEAEEVFAQMLNGDYEYKNWGPLEIVSKFMQSKIEHFSIGSMCEEESAAIKEELPVAFETPHFVEIKIEQHSNDCEPENIDTSEAYQKSIEPCHSESEDDLPLVNIKIEIEEEMTERNGRADETTGAPVAKRPKTDETTLVTKKKKHGHTGSEVTGLTNQRTTKCDRKCYECDVCQRSFTKNSSLKRHIRTHTGEKPYKCDICKHSFTQNVSLNIHMRTHTDDKPFKCDICQRSFNKKSNLKRHIGTHTGEKPYKCDICKHSFTQNISLKIHMRTHTGDKLYKCYICQRSFTKNARLKIHMYTHTGDKPYRCDICQHSFTCIGKLKIHTRTHTGDKPFKCDICQRSFAKNSDLKVHMRTHTGEKPFKCDICQRSFALRSRLIRHNLVHSGDKPYKCEICQRSFTRNDHLKDHIRTHAQ